MFSLLANTPKRKHHKTCMEKLVIEANEEINMGINQYLTFNDPKTLAIFIAELTTHGIAFKVSQSCDKFDVEITGY